MICVLSTYLFKKHPKVKVFMISIGHNFMKNITVKGQRLREGASDWYMRFHSNFDKDKRLWDILNQNYIILRDLAYLCNHRLNSDKDRTFHSDL